MDPRLLDLALALVALEGLALALWRRWRGAGPRRWLANLIAGGSLLLLARATIAHSGVLLPLAALTAALVAHGFDLAARWEPKRGS